MAIRFVDGVNHYNTPWVFVKWPGNSNAVVDATTLRVGSVGTSSLKLNGGYVERRFDNIKLHWRFGMNVQWSAGATSFPSQTMILRFGSTEYPAVKELWYMQANDISTNPHFEIWGNGKPDGSGTEQPYARLASWDFSIVASKAYYLEFFGNPFAYEWYKLAWDGTTVISEVTGPADGPVADVIFRINNDSSASVPTMWVDNIYGLDNTTPGSTDFLALPSNTPQVVSVHPSAQGNYAMWGFSVPVGLHGTNHYKYVDEVLVNQNDYIADRSSGDKESYIPTPITSALPVILAVQSVLTMRVPSNNSRGFCHLIRSDTPSDDCSSTYDSYNLEFPDNFIQDSDPNPVFQSESTDRALIGYWRSYVHVFETQPESPNPVWTVADINSSEFGIELKTLPFPLNPGGNTIRFTQHVLEVLIRGTTTPPTLPEDQPGIEQIKSKTHSFARLWKIQPETGASFRFTDHNQNILNPSDGLVYTPIEGIKTSAHLRELGLEPAVMELQGIVNQNAVDLDYNMLHGTTMRGAKVTEYLVDWVYSWAGILTRDVGFLDIFTYDSEKWFATVFSQLAPLTWPAGKLYSRVCRHILGDVGCQFDLLSLKETSIAVSSVPTTVRNRSFFTASGLPTSPDAQGNDRSANGYWSFGTLTWVRGSNIGLSHEIQSSEESGKIVLSVPTPFIIEVGDDFDITPGCDKLLGSCNVKFNNLPNFGGFPTVPGYDRAHQPLGTSTRVFGIGDFLDLLL